jgi:DNA repair protein RadC
LDSKLKVLTTKTITSGTVNSATPHPREIIKEALFCNAVSVILSHNHPSDVLQPSCEDIYVTGAVEKALASVGIQLADHIIVCGDKAVSMADEGFIGQAHIKELPKVASAVYEKRENFTVSDSKKRSSVRAQLAQSKNQRLLGEGKTINRGGRESR